MLEQLHGEGHIYGLDVDPIESVKTKKRLEDLGFGEDIMTVRQMNFADIDQIAKEVGPFDFILADLGVSSMQIDNPERGFSYKFDGPLDLRLNPHVKKELLTKCSTSSGKTEKESRTKVSHPCL